MSDKITLTVVMDLVIDADEYLASIDYGALIKELIEENFDGQIGVENFDIISEECHSDD